MPICTAISSSGADEISNNNAATATTTTISTLQPTSTAISTARTNNSFDCLICCASSGYSTTGAGLPSENEKNVLFDFLCALLNVQLPPVYSWDFSKDIFPLCLRCSCVIQDMFHMQRQSDGIRLEIIEKAEKIKHTIFNCVELRRKKLLSFKKRGGKSDKNSDNSLKDFQYDDRCEFFRYLVIKQNLRQLRNSSANNAKISVSPSHVNDVTRASNVSMTMGFKEDSTNDDISLTDFEVASDILDEASLSFSIDSIHSEDSPKNVFAFAEGDQLTGRNQECMSISESLDDFDTFEDELEFPESLWFTSDDWQSLMEKTNAERKDSEDDALYKVLISDTRNIDIEPLLEKANLTGCSFSYDESFAAQSSVDSGWETHSSLESAHNSNLFSEHDTNHATSKTLADSSDNCEVINEDSDDDLCLVEETVNKSTRDKSSAQKNVNKVIKRDKVNIIMTTHSVVSTDLPGTQDIIIEQKTPIQVYSEIFMPVNGENATELWQCILCGKIVRNFKNHKAVHFPGQHRCHVPGCHAVFRRKDNLNAHLRAKH